MRRAHSRLPAYIPKDILDKVNWVEGDVNDVVSLDEAMEGVQAVIHAAGIVSFQEKDRAKMEQVNVEGTANMVNMALEKKIARFVHISSIAALGRTKKCDLVNEEKKWESNKINTPYAVTKYKAEMEVWRAMGEGLNAVIVNPSTVIGFGDWHSTSCRIFKSVYDGFSWYTKGINGFVDVEDVARATVSLMETAITEQRYIVNGDNWTFQHLFNRIAQGFHVSPPTKEATPRLAAIAWRLEKIKTLFSRRSPLLTRYSTRVALSETIFDNRKILQALPGFSFTPLEKTIENACKNYLAALK
jgi:nucleoside-diphosphate-sugar epimerase